VPKSHCSILTTVSSFHWLFHPNKNGIIERHDRRRHPSLDGEASEKTALYSIESLIETLPDIWTISVQVLSALAPDHTDGTLSTTYSEAVPSHSLRRQAIEGWLQKVLDLKQFSKTYAIQLDGKGKNLNRVMFLLKDELEDPTKKMVKKLGNCSSHVHKTRKTVRPALGDLEFYRLNCTFKKGISAADPTHSSYWHMLDTILRRCATTQGIEHSVCDTSGGILLEAVEDHSSDKLRAFSFDPTFGSTNGLTALISVQGRIDVRGPTAFHIVELILAPGVQEGKNPAEMFNGIFSHGDQPTLTTMRKTLVGLQVQKTYCTPRSKGTGPDSPVFTIRDVKLPDEVDVFKHGRKSSL